MIRRNAQLVNKNIYQSYSEHHLIIHSQYYNSKIPFDMIMSLIVALG